MNKYEFYVHREIPLFPFGDIRDKEYQAERKAKIEALRESGDYDTWTVDLPHQCDEWAVVDRAEHAEAVAGLEKFIEEAQEALRKLKKRKEDR